MPTEAAWARNPAKQQIASFVFFGVLCAFTLSTGDGGPIATFILSGLMLLTAAAYLARPRNEKLTFGLPAVCLFAITAYGLVQTLFFPQKIFYNGWTGVLFWFTAAAMTCIAMQLFQLPREASRFRLWFIVFGTAVCVLDLLQQASGDQ